MQRYTIRVPLAGCEGLSRGVLVKLAVAFVPRPEQLQNRQEVLRRIIRVRRCRYSENVFPGVNECHATIQDMTREDAHLTDATVYGSDVHYIAHGDPACF